MKIIITAGGTIEPIDSVRFITNMSTGALGSKIANQLVEILSEKKNIFEIIYISPDHALKPIENENIRLVSVKDTKSVLETMQELLTNEHIDTCIHSMAVSDYTVERVIKTIDLVNIIEENELSKEEIIELLINPPREDNSSKISSQNDMIDIRLCKTPKIIDIIKELSPGTKLIGFKLLSNVSEEELIETAQKSLNRTLADYIIANDLNTIEEENHKVFIVQKEGVKEDPIIGKENVAKRIAEIAIEGDLS